MTYISDLEYNPDFPFAAVGPSGVVYALFKYEEDADGFLETSSTWVSKVIDTRPKPKPKPKHDPKDGEVWMITEGTGKYASKVPFLALVRGGHFIFGSAYETQIGDDGLDRLEVEGLNYPGWAGHRVHIPEGDD